MQRHKVLKRSTFIFLTFFLLISLNSPSHANNILFSCDFDSGSGDEWDRWQQCAGDFDLKASEGGGDKRSLATDGVDGSYCAKNDATSGHAWTPLYIHLNDPYPDELTIVYYEKIKAVNDLPLPGANIKSIRMFNSETDYQIGSIISHHFNSYFYMSKWDTGQFIPGDKVYKIKSYTGYCSDNGDGTFTCDGTDGEGGELGRLSFKWEPFVKNNTWYQIRTYRKMPSSDTSHDGEVKVWINGELLVDLRDIKIRDGSNSHFEKICWLPSDDADDGFSHYLDDVTVYEGYVPPGSDDSSGLPIPNIYITAK